MYSLNSKPLNLLFDFRNQMMQNCLMSRKLPTLTRTPLVTRPTSLLSRAAPANRSQEPVNRNRRGPPTNPVRTITSTQPTTPSSQSCRTIRLSISWTTRTRLRLGITRTRGRRRKRPTKSDITYSPHPHPHPFRHTEGMGATLFTSLFWVFLIQINLSIDLYCIFCFIWKSETISIIFFPAIFWIVVLYM